MRVSGRTAAAIAASLEHSLHTRKRGPGEALPTVRDLAATVGVSPATVAAAYKLLRARGLVAGEGRRGTRVASGPVTPTTVAPPAVPAGTIDLATGNPDPVLLPPLESAIRSMESGVRLYGGAPDRGGLVAFAATEFEADGISAQSVAVLSGALDAIERILREHLRAGDRVAVEDPSFPGVIDLVSTSGYAVVPFALDDDGPQPDAVSAALGRGCGAIIVTPRAQNPTGAAISVERAGELRRVLRRFPDVVLIENDYAGPVAGAALQTVRSASHDRWAVVRSTSKFLGPDLRVAVMAGDDMTVARVRGRQALGARWVSHILQQLALALWSDPSSGRRLARAGEIYAQRRNAALVALGAHGVVARGRSGFNVWIPVRDEARVVRELGQRGWAVAAGERFRMEAEAGIRVTLSTLQPADAGRFAADLADVLRPTATSFA
jgi:DNA-binding transcriptional MocR family regulator